MAILPLKTNNAWWQTVSVRIPRGVVRVLREQLSDEPDKSVNTYLADLIKADLAKRKIPWDSPVRRPS